jgi:hypothetical protein
MEDPPPKLPWLGEDAEVEEYAPPPPHETKTHRRQRRYGCPGRSPSDTFYPLKGFFTNHTRGLPCRSRPRIEPRRWDATIKALKSYRRRRYLVKPKLYNTQH